ncbi:hypothetical protein EC957_001715 [Mortierella hygrophila]|uniref:SET domain-containing protein n=1 Tax=Mortierella hygrophila TaxID=979708 RepID=A0A9P6F5A1_9FUNG|nr:hypothetical protein EC957_001715 [Mortierella hygrophila]
MDPAETTTTPSLSLSLAPTAPPTPPLTPPPTLALVGQQQEDKKHQATEEDAFPIKVTMLPNKGRSYVATRTIQPQELIFVAEAFGTTMCDPWLDCGICHYCWAEILNRKSQIRLPSALPASAKGTRTGTGSERGSKGQKGGKGKKQETVMVFCDETCLEMYGPEAAEMICRVEEKIRRTWSDSGSRAWKLKMGPCKESKATIGHDTPSTSSATTIAAPHYSELIEQALAAADTKKRILELSDTDLALFLDTTWSAFDGLIAEQESWIAHPTTATTGTTKNDRQHNTQQHSRTQAQCGALFPKLAKLLLEGNNQATIAPKTSDDDCETIRLVSEILCRRQIDMRAAISGMIGDGTEVVSVQEGESVKGPATAVLSKDEKPPGSHSSLCGGQRAMFEDYCAMQSNELILFRQQLQEDIHNQDEQSDNDEQEQEQEQEQEEQSIQYQGHKHSQELKHDTNMRQWRTLISILPNHLLSCFYAYLRVRDAYFLLSCENAATSSSDTPSHQERQITLSIDNTFFRTILYREVANSFGIRDSSDELLGFAVFPRASFFNHSCRPNIQKKRRQSSRVVKARQMEYWSTGVIMEGEECCISYGDISTGVEERRARLEDMYFFWCSCLRCLEEDE